MGFLPPVHSHSISPFLEEQGYVPCATVPSGDPEHLRYARDAWATSEPRMYAPTRLPHHAQAMLLALILSWLGGLVAWWRGCRLSGGLAVAGRTRTGWCLSIATRNAARPRAQQSPAPPFLTAESRPRKPLTRGCLSLTILSRTFSKTVCRLFRCDECEATALWDADMAAASATVFARGKCHHAGD